MEDKLTALVSPEIEFTLGEKTYRVRKANLEKGILFRKKVKELLKEDDGANDYRLLAYAIYILLRDQDASVTEESLMNLISADVDVNQYLVQLGFLRPQVGIMSAAINRSRSTGGTSSQQSPTGQVGPQEKSPN